MLAPVNVFGLPQAYTSPLSIQDWLRTPLFTCRLSADEQQNPTEPLVIKLEKNGQLIARAFFDGSGVEKVQGSSKHFILTLCNGALRAQVGIAFLDRSHAIDFSFLLHDRVGEPREFPIGSNRRPLASLANHDDAASQDDSDTEDDFGEFQ